MTATQTGRFALALFLACLSGPSASPQGPPQPVSWSIAANPKPSVRPGTHLTIELTAHIDDGWHVYAFNQAKGGPTPLRITAEPEGLVQLAGTPSGTSPLKQHDSSFDLDTEIFSHVARLHVPVMVKPHPAANAEEIGLDIRFQACSDRICLPPKTVRLTLPFTKLADGQ